MSKVSITIAAYANPVIPGLIMSTTTRMWNEQQPEAGSLSGIEDILAGTKDSANAGWRQATPFISICLFLTLMVV